MEYVRPPHPQSGTPLAWGRRSPAPTARRKRRSFRRLGRVARERFRGAASLLDFRSEAVAGAVAVRPAGRAARLVPGAVVVQEAHSTRAPPPTGLGVGGTLVGRAAVNGGGLPACCALRVIVYR